MLTYNEIVQYRSARLGSDARRRSYRVYSGRKSASCAQKEREKAADATAMPSGHLSSLVMGREGEGGMRRGRDRDGGWVDYRTARGEGEGGRLASGAEGPRAFRFSCRNGVRARAFTCRGAAATGSFSVVSDCDDGIANFILRGQEVGRSDRFLRNGDCVKGAKASLGR